MSGLIQRITNGVIQDGQFDALTVGEIRQVAETFQSVILGLHHQRVEYPETSAITSGDMEVVSKPPMTPSSPWRSPDPTPEVEPPPYARSSAARERRHRRGLLRGPR